LLDPSLLVDECRVVGYEQIEKLLPLLVPFQGIDRKAFAAIVLEVCTA
jgi:hypothetical protein